MAITAEKALLNNQSILQNFGLVQEIDEQAAEIISGGYERFTIKNETEGNIYYYVDGTRTKREFAKPGTSSVWTTFGKGTIKFDTDERDDVINWKEYNLDSGRVYAFRENKSTSDPFDIELYAVG
ncbi:hypothetical protein VB638_15530 [Dolichospermum sp. UHCC 0684]|uniref:hypothetical protein n=1 Tax=unclassified Dolichospermum TaxID=2622029 RepID=UPI0014455464|nr:MULTISPECIES: hypothetical protein [unclassified Dolichospermum]MBS9385640.1 hypothetical protein [Dolichospermum sp. BR01]MEA5530963.1 hypothetical protein [Dolichospermum sp. UHCC 0684]MTJ36306.1 hypothetical protein [Dolichospermum sp. UHCC 0260]